MDHQIHRIPAARIQNSTTDKSSLRFLSAFSSFRVRKHPSHSAKTARITAPSSVTRKKSI